MKKIRVKYFKLKSVKEIKRRNFKDIFRKLNSEEIEEVEEVLDVNLFRMKFK